MEADGNSEEPSLLVLVLFKTDLGHPYKVPESSISIPASLTRFGLSTVVNNLITSVNPYWESEPFDFLIKNELVRMWLEKFLLAKNISAATFSNPVAGGGIHPLTKYVMNYLRILTDYGETLNFLFEDSADADSISLSPDTSPTSDEENKPTDSPGRIFPMKVKGDELRPIFGDGWLRKCNGKVQQQALPEI
ncbi:hypothetical protein ACFX2J_023540 [Malus domestica]